MVKRVAIGVVGGWGLGFGVLQSRLSDILSPSEGAEGFGGHRSSAAEIRLLGLRACRGESKRWREK